MDEGVEYVGCWCDDGSCVVVRVWCWVWLVVRVAVFSYCAAMLVRQVLRAAKHGWGEMSAAELRGADGVFLADEGFVVGLRVCSFPLSPCFFLRT